MTPLARSTPCRRHPAAGAPRRSALCLLAGLTAASPAARAAETSGPPVAVVARVSQAGDVTRLAIDLSGMVAAHAFLLDKPDRAIIDLPEINFQMPADTGRAVKAGLIRSFRFGLFAPGKSRIVIDLTGPATLRKTSIDSIAGGAPSRLLVELSGSDRASFRAAVRRDEAPPPAPDPATPMPTASASALPVVVIDPGHGGIDPGARGLDGSSEKTVVFEFASALAAKLTGSGHYRVVLTRTGDSFVALGERVRIAREAGAALFVSVHADTLSDPSVTGATVYTVSDKASDAEAARVAASENRADENAGLKAAADTSGITDILFELTRRETRTYAHLYQRTLVGYWQKIARLNRNPERSAGFKVLQAPDVPSVLLELGYMSNSLDSRTLASAEWRDKATTGVARSIDAFFGQRRQLDAATGSPPPDRPPAAAVSVQSHP